MDEAVTLGTFQNLSDTGNDIPKHEKSVLKEAFEVLGDESNFTTEFEKKLKSDTRKIAFSTDHLTESFGDKEEVEFPLHSEVIQEVEFHGDTSTFNPSVDVSIVEKNNVMFSVYEESKEEEYSADKSPEVSVTYTENGISYNGNLLTRPSTTDDDNIKLAANITETSPEEPTVLQRSNALGEIDYARDAVKGDISYSTDEEGNVHTFVEILLNEQGEQRQDVVTENLVMSLDEYQEPNEVLETSDFSEYISSEKLPESNAVSFYQHTLNNMENENQYETILDLPTVGDDAVQQGNAFKSLEETMFKTQTQSSGDTLTELNEVDMQHSVVETELQEPIQVKLVSTDPVVQTFPESFSVLTDTGASTIPSRTEALEQLVEAEELLVRANQTLATFEFTLALHVEMLGSAKQTQEHADDIQALYVELESLLEQLRRSCDSQTESSVLVESVEWTVVIERVETITTIIRMYKFEITEKLEILSKVCLEKEQRESDEREKRNEVLKEAEDISEFAGQEHRAMVLRQVQLWQQLENHLESQSSILCGLQKYESILRGKETEENGTTLPSSNQSDQRQRLVSIAQTVSDQTRRVNCLSHTIEQSQDCGNLFLRTPLPWKKEATSSELLRRELESNLEQLQASLQNDVQESSESGLVQVDRYILIITTIEEWCRVVEYRIVISQQLTTEPALQEYTTVSKEMDQMLLFCDQLREVTQALAFKLDDDDVLRANVLHCLETISDRLKAVSLLTKAAHQRTSQDNEKASKLQEELCTLKQSVSLEVQSLEEICNTFEGQEELPVVQGALCKVETIQEEVENVCHQCLEFQLLHPGQRLAMTETSDPVISISDLISLETQLQALQKQMSYQRQDPDAREQNFMVEKFNTLLNSVCELSSAGRTYLQMDPLVMDQPEDMKIHLSQMKNLFFCLHVQCQRLRSTYASLNEENGNCLGRKHQSTVFEVHSLLEESQIRIVQFNRCLESWTHLLPLLSDAEAWLKDFAARNSTKEPVSRINIQNLLSQSKDKQAELDRHLPQLYALLALQGHFSQANVICPSLERRMELFQQQRQQLATQVSLEVKDLTSHLLEWQSFESNLECFRKWLENSQECLEILQTWWTEKDEQVAIGVLLEKAMDLKKLQSEQKHQELFYHQFKDSLYLCQVLGLYDSFEARELRQSVADRWYHLSWVVKELQDGVDQLLKQQTSLSGELECDKAAWPAKKQNEMEDLKSKPVESFNDVHQRETAFRNMEDELETMLMVLDSASYHNSDLKPAREQTLALLSEARITSCQNKNLLHQWTQLQKSQKQLLEFLTEAETSLCTTKDVLAAPVRLEQAQRESDRIEALHQDLQTKEEDLKKVLAQGEEIVMNISHSSLIVQAQVLMKDLDSHWKKVWSMILDVRIALRNKLRDWENYRKMFEAVNKLLDEVACAVEISDIPACYLEQAQLNNEALQQSLEELNENLPLLVSLENASLKLRGEETCNSNIQTELQNEYAQTLQRWQSEESSLQSLCSQQLELSTSWTTLETNLREMNHWISTTLSQIQLLDYGRPGEQDITQFELLRGCVSQHGQAMQDINKLTDIICQSELLSDEGKTAVRAKSEKASNLLSKLQQMLGRKLEDLSKADKQMELRHNTARRVQDCFRTVQDQVLNADVPPDSEAWIRELEITESAMNELVTCEMELVLLKDILCQQRHSDPALITQVVCLLALWQSLCLKICSRHSDLVASSSKKPFAYRCQSLMTIFLCLRNTLSQNIPCHYADIVREAAQLKMLEQKMCNHRPILESTLEEGSSLLRLWSKEHGVESGQLSQWLQELQLEWISMSVILSQRHELLNHLTVLWRRCTKARHHLQHWCKEMRNKTGLFSAKVQHPEPDTMERIFEEEANIENQLSTWPTTEKLTEELQTASKDLAIVLDSQTAESIAFNCNSLLIELEDLKTDLEARRKQLHDWGESGRSLDHDLNTLQNTVSAIMAVPEPQRPLRVNEQADCLSDCEDRLHSITECQGSLNKIQERHTHLQNDMPSVDWQFMCDQLTTLDQITKTTKARTVMLQQSMLRDVERRQQFGQSIEALLAWIRTTEHRITESQEHSLHVRLGILQKLESEVQDRTAYLSHLTAKGKTLLAGPTSEPPLAIKPDDPVQDQLDGLAQAWQRMKNNLQEKLDTARRTQDNLRKLKKELRCFSHWVQEKEQILTAPVWFNEPTKEEIDLKTQELMAIREEIALCNSELELLFVLCQELESSPQMAHDKLERKSLKKKLLLLQEQYQKLFGLVTDRDIFYHRTQDEWEHFTSHMKKMESRLDEQEKLENNHRTLAHLHNLSDTKEELETFEGLVEKIQANVHLAEELTSQFCHLKNIYCLDVSGHLSSQFNRILARWNCHAGKCKSGLRRLRHSVEIWDDFQAQREHLMVWLTELDMKVTRVLVSGNLNRIEKVDHLKACQDELQQGEWESTSWEQQALYLQQRSHYEDGLKCESEVAELRTYLNEIDARITECILLMAPSGISPDEVDGSIDEDPASETPLTEQTPISREDVGRLVSHSSVSTSSGAFPSSDVTDIESLPSNTDEASSAGAVLEAYPGHLDEEESSILSRELEAALAEAETRLSALENLLRCPTPEAYEQGVSSMDFSHLLAACHSTMDVVQHLSETGETSEVKRFHASVDAVTHQWEYVQNWALEKERRFRTAQAQWHDLLSGLIQLEHWMGNAQEQISKMWTDTPEDVHKLEVLIHMHRKFLLEMQHNNKVAISVRHLCQKLTQTQRARHRSQPDQPLELILDCPPAAVKGPHAESVCTRLQNVNYRLESIRAAALAWQSSLQMALLQCSEFEAMVSELSAWLDDREIKARILADVDDQDSDIASKHLKKFLDLLQDLGRYEPRIEVLQSTYAQLFIETEPDSGEDVIDGVGDQREIVEEGMVAAATSDDRRVRGRDAVQEARAQLVSLVTRLRVLHQFCIQQIHRLRSSLGDTELEEVEEKIKEERSALFMLPSTSQERPDAVDGANDEQDDDTSGSSLGRYYRYMMRVARASLPIQALMLLLLGVASLLPMAEEDFSCILTNNFARSFDPMLRYPNGPPPV